MLENYKVVKAHYVMVSVENFRTKSGRPRISRVLKCDEAATFGFTMGESESNFSNKGPAVKALLNLITTSERNRMYLIIK